MKVLIISSGNSGEINVCVKDQAKSLFKMGITTEHYLIVGKGILGYLKNLRLFKNNIKNFGPDLIHAHYGLSGLLAILQRKIPVVITFHGGDIYLKQSNLAYLGLSWLGSLFSNSNIFVTNNIPILFKCNKHDVIPCGLQMDIFYNIDKEKARKELRFNNNKKYILFAGQFDDAIKNYPLAQKAISILNQDVVLLELDGYSRKEVNLLMNAVDLFLLTSISEGSPATIKEAMACNCPIVSVDVGDVKEVMGKTKNCFLSTYEPEDVSKKIKKALICERKNNGRDRIKKIKLDNESVEESIMNLYKKVLK